VISTIESAQTEGVNQERRSFWIGAAFLALITLAAYSSVFHAGFIWDDDDYVTNNPCLRSLSGLTEIWREPAASPQYYPMVFTFFWIQFQLWGLNPFGYHLVNILLHIVNALLLWRCIDRLRIPGAFWAACIFALHPVHVESVAWITELKNILSTTFYFLSFICYCRFSAPEGEETTKETVTRYYYILSLLFFLLALFSKTVAGSLPAAILLVYWWKRGAFPKLELVRLLPFFTLAAYLGSRTAYLEIHHVRASGPEWDFNFIERLLIAARAVWFYLGKLFWPRELIFTYPRWHINSDVWWHYLFPIGLLLLLTLLWLVRKRFGYGPLASLLFFVGTLFPALGFFNFYPMLYSFVADHFQYLASAGIIILFCATVVHFFPAETGTWFGARTIMFMVILVVLAILTRQQGTIYFDRMTLFNDVIAKNPSSWMAYNNRGADFYSRGKYEEALADFQKALDLNPNNAAAYNNRGMLHAHRHDTANAMLDINSALSIEPDRSDFLVNRGKLYRDMGMFDPALADFDRALQLSPAYISGHLNRAIVYGMREEYDRAMADINEVLRLNPYDSDGYANRGLILFRRGMLDSAILDYSRSLELNPDSKQTLFNRALAYAATGDRERATADLQQARKRGYPLTDGEIKMILAGDGNSN